jgi:hypothetical protein
VFGSAQRALARFGRWPRRVAAVCCLVLAAGSALAPHAPAQPARHASLRPGEVAVPVTVQTSAAVAVGDRVGVLAGPSDAGDDAALVADQLRVLSVRGGPGGFAGDATTVVTVATSRAAAVQLARYANRTLVLIADPLP